MKQGDCFLSDEELHFYLDGEIDSNRKAHLDDHLAHCPDCRLRFDVESRMKSLVGESCGSLSAPGWLKDKIIAALDEESARPQQGFWAFLAGVFSNRPMIPIGIVATLVIAFFISIYSLPHNSDTMPIVTAVIHEHYEYLESPAEKGIATSNIEEASNWLFANSGIEVDLASHKSLPPPAQACVLNEHGETICYVGFDYDNTRVSLFLFKGDDEKIFGPRMIQKGSIDVFCGRCTDMNYALWRENDLISVLVGDLPEENLMQLADSMF